MSVELRAITDDEVPAFHRALHLHFGKDADQDPDGAARMRALIEPGRGYAAFDDGAMVATAATFTHTLIVPGGTVPMAGLTMVTVRPTHRRRGILRGLMELHLGDARARGEPVSGLWASEASIYGRFGYGVACETDELAFHARGLEIRGGGGDRIDLIEASDAEAALSPIFARMAASRPGMFLRTPAWWQYRRIRDRPDFRGAASPRRFALATRDGEGVGWIIYRQRAEWHDDIPGGHVAIEELGAIDGRAEASLWRYVCGIDLFPEVHWERAPVDCLLPWIVSDPRRIRRRRGDTLWLRPLDVGALLASRSYACNGTVRLAVEGETWELAVSGGRAECTRSTAAPDVTLDRAALGSLFLGGVRAPLLARAGLLTGDALACDRLFAWPVAPYCQEMF